MALLHQAVVPDTPVIFKLGLGGDEGVCMSTQPLHIEIKQQTTVAVVSWPGTVEVLNTSEYLIFQTSKRIVCATLVVLWFRNSSIFRGGGGGLTEYIFY